MIGDSEHITIHVVPMKHSSRFCSNYEAKGFRIGINSSFPVWFINKLNFEFVIKNFSKGLTLSKERVKQSGSLSVMYMLHVSAEWLKTDLSMYTTTHLNRSNSELYI